jgi:hypothetical protein
MRALLKTVGILLAIAALGACNKGSDSNGAAQPPGQNPGVNPLANQWNNGLNGAQDLSTVNIVTINGEDRIINLSLTVQPMQSQPVTEYVTNLCDIRNLNDTPREKKYPIRFGRNIYDLNLIFDAQGNLSIIMLSRAGFLRSSAPVGYKLNEMSQTIEIDPFILQGVPGPKFVGEQQELSLRLAQLQERERRRYEIEDRRRDRRDRRDRDDRGDYRDRDEGLRFEFGAEFDDGLSDMGFGSEYGNDYGYSTNRQQGFRSGFQLGQDPNPAHRPPANSSYANANPGMSNAGSISAHFGRMIGLIHVVEGFNTQHITHIEVGNPLRRYRGHVPYASYSIRTTVTMNSGVCESKIRVPRADFTLQ